MLSQIAQLTGALLLIIGTSFCILGVYGLLRLGDLYNRLHAAGMVITLGATSIMLSLLFIGPPQAGIKALATALFFLFTGPLITHVLARTAHLRGVAMEKESARDDLVEDRQKQQSPAETPPISNPTGPKA
jgi:multicomponent Na+:H+ antiporter subunit G